jgi:type IV secretory pathway VirB10-like protein
MQWMRRLLVSAHVGFALLLFIQPQWTPARNSHKPLIVKTIERKSATHVATAKPKGSQKVAKAVAPPPPATAPVAKASPAPKKKAEPAIQQKKKGAAAPPKPEPPRATFSPSLARELEESLAKIEGKSNKKEMKREPQPLALSVDVVERAEYTDLLIAHLRETLTLPAYGAVKIQLRLRQDGTVIKLVVLSAESAENKRYLEKHLPAVRFPRPESSSEDEFVLTFVNES